METIEDPAMKKVRQLDKLVDELAKGSFLEEIKDQEGDILISTHAIAMKGILEYQNRGWRCILV